MQKAFIKKDLNCSYLKITLAHDVKYTVVSLIFFGISEGN